MTQDEEQKNQIPLLPKRGISDFRKALLGTVISLVIFGLICIFLIGVLEFALISIVATMFVATIITAIIYMVKGKSDIAAGIFTGLGIVIGLVVIIGGVTCFVMLSAL